MAAKHVRTALSVPSLTSTTALANSFRTVLRTLSTPTPSRSFSSQPALLNWLAPKAGESRKSRKGRPHIPTGGSTKGTTLVHGTYGLRLISHDQRISANQLKIADATIRQRLRGEKYRLFHRVCANIGVYTSGNDQRMGKGKGGFDYWCARVSVSRVVFELEGGVHEAVVRDAMRLAGNKLPGQWEFVRAGDPPVMGRTKVGGDGLKAMTEAELRRPRMSEGHAGVSLMDTASRLPATSPTPI